MEVAKILAGLNEPQSAAVQYCDGPSLVIAGAGSGKTRVLTYKMAYLISRGLPPSRILALTFTNKAAKEMKDRIDNLLGYAVSRNLWMGTFHAICGRILRAEADKIGFSSNYTIYDASDSANVLKDIFKRLDINEEFYKVKKVAEKISRLKNNMFTPAAYEMNAELLAADREYRQERFVEIFKEYNTSCLKSNAMDFDDMLLYVNVLFKKFPKVLAKYQSLFDYILVDEYQDTNFAQYLIVNKLAKPHQRLCVVGDDAQSIYSFRGARITNILNFKNDYPTYKLFKLEQNYRSTQTIVNASNSLISNNNIGIKKNVFSKNVEGGKIVVKELETDNMEGNMVASAILASQKRTHCDFSDFAILYRTNRQSRIMEEALQKRSIPYKIWGGMSFYQRKEIKDIIAYLRLCVNNNDKEAFKRIVNFPSRKIGEASVNKLLTYVGHANVPLWDVVSHIEHHPVDLNVGTRTRLKEFASLIIYLSAQINNFNAYEYMNEVVSKSGLMNLLETDQSPEGKGRLENVHELFNGAQSFCAERVNDPELRTQITVVDYLANVSLLTDRQGNDDDDDNCVRLMTVHASKGLEFRNVFIVGVEEMLFPGAASTEEDEIEEERRLFYVAMTRAKEHLTLSYCKSRFFNGEFRHCHSSRFISDIAPQYLDNPVEDENDDMLDFFAERRAFYANDKPQQFSPNKPVAPGRLTPAAKRKLVKVDKATQRANNRPVGDFHIGTRVRHKVFGTGVVKAVSNEPDGAKLQIDFGVEGIRTLLLKMAKLEIIS